VALAQSEPPISTLGVTFDKTSTQSGQQTSFLSYNAYEETVTEESPYYLSGVSVQRPNSGIDTLQQDSDYPYLWSYQSSGYSSLAGLDAQYGLGDYTFKGDVSGSPDLSATLDNSVQMWNSSSPTVTNDSALQNYNINHELVVDFTPFRPNGSATNSIGTAEILTTSGELEYFESGTATKDSLTIPNGFLNPDQTYDFEIIDENQLQFSASSSFGNGQPVLNYDTVTIDQFTTLNTVRATPEPAPIVIMAMGLLGIRARRSRRRAFREGVEPSPGTF
jgi:hypothetical protein